jgi:hypothetical protein
MLTFKELLSGHTLSEVPIAHQHNGEELLKRMNLVRTAWAKPMLVTSGYRSLQDHLRIYSQLASKRGVEFDPKKVPMGSSHLSFSAVDISDPDGSLYEWCQANKKILEDVGLWCEEKDDQARVHFQIYQPKSGKRFFKP